MTAARYSAVRYKVAHDLLVDGIGTPEDYSKDWTGLANEATRLVHRKGFEPLWWSAAQMVRERLRSDVSEASILREGAKAPTSESGAAAAAGKKRALALKTLRHLYYHESFGEQRIWILSLPKNIRAFPMEYQGDDHTSVDAVLNSRNEIFDAAARGYIADAAQTALAWIEKAMIVAGTPFIDQHRALIRRWFVPAGTVDEFNLVTAISSLLRIELQKIAAGLKSGTIIFTDSPHERGTNSKLENAGAFVFPNNDLTVIYVEKAFFNSGGTLSGRALWAYILVHELSHLYAKTVDHSYAWQGLLPRDTDVLKRGNDAAVARNIQFPTVRTLTSRECIENADSWAYFVADCAGALSFRDRGQALGNELYQYGGQAMEAPLVETIKARIGMT